MTHEGNACECKMCAWMKKHPVWRGITIVIVVFVVLACLGNCFSNGNDKDVQKDTIVVSGKGEKIVKPDMATVSFSVMEESLDVSKASEAVNKKIADIIETLKADGVEEKDIKTTDYSVYPRYDYIKNGEIYSPGGTRALAGYDVTQSIEVKIRNLSNAGKIITDLGSLNVTNMGGLNFTNDKYDELVREARDAAIADARAEAKKLAKSLGVRLVKITGYSEGSNYPVYYAKAESAYDSRATGAAVPNAVVPTGENKITSTVSISYEIR